MSLTVDPITEDAIAPAGQEEKAGTAGPPAETDAAPDDGSNEVPDHEQDASAVFEEGQSDQEMGDASGAGTLEATTEPTVEPTGSPSPKPADDGVDITMSEEVPVNGVNGTNGHDVQMSEGDAQSPPETPALALQTPEASTSYVSPKLEQDTDGPPTKRPRVYSDADRASLAHSATPPPASQESVPTPIPTPSTSAPAPAPSQPSHSTTRGLTKTQHHFISNSIKNIKKQKDAGPFLAPVDPIALNIPHYPSIIPHPMDLGTIERKVASSNPTRPDHNPSNPRYTSVDQFIDDVRLVFRNCLTFNGPDHQISHMARRLQEVFDRSMKHAPGPDDPIPRMPPPPPVKKAAPARRLSHSNTARPDPPPVARPKREQLPPPKEVFLDPKKRKARSVDPLTLKQLNFCGKILQELHRRQHFDYASAFYDPVDWVKMEIPSYPKIVKKPMDLGTMKRKLDAGEYPNASKFHEDFKLMIRNCFAFNPVGTPVCNMGVRTQQVFDEKWRQLPQAEPQLDDASDEDDDSDSDADYARAIVQVEMQIKDLQDKLQTLKSSKLAKDKKRKAERAARAQEESARARAAAAAAATPKPPRAPKAPKKSGGGGSLPKAPKRAAPEDDGALSFSQKKDLSEAIQQLDGVKLEKVIKIIHEGVPEIRDSTEEIEIEIDRLPGPVLTRLYNFVIRPSRPVAGKRSRHGKGTGTGGLKRKSMDEDVEAEKIRQLEQRMQMFEHTVNGAPIPSAVAAGGAGGSDSDSSSNSDSSGSDSE